MTRGTKAQVFAWLIAQPSITAPVASATSPARLDHIMGATHIALDGDPLKA
jgi:aryl-alcohol dehydrogenase-like predicted oxidoreductase